MTVSTTDFTAAMRQFPAAVNLITTGKDEQRAGLTATAVFSLTAEPPQIAVAVNRSASAYPRIMENGCFCANTLTADHDELARAFSGAVKGIQRFATGNWTTLTTGAPVLADALISMDCVVDRTIDFSTHTLFIGEVKALRVGATTRPLLFVNGQWASLIPATKSDLDRIAEFIQQSVDSVDQALASPDDDSVAIENFIQSFTELNIAQQDITKAHLGAELYAAPETLEKLNTLKRMFDERFYEFLQRGVERGEFDIENPRLASFALVGMVVWSFKWYRPDGRLSPSEIGAMLGKLARRAIESHPDDAHSSKPAAESESAQALTQGLSRKG